VSRYLVQRKAADRLDAIYQYTCDQWGEAQAERYIRGLFDAFERIAARALPWRPIAAEFCVDGYVYHHESHYIYWKILPQGAVGIVTILHERMHLPARLHDDWQ
jgi:toxin ParE1/3/4